MDIKDFKAGTLRNSGDIIFSPGKDKSFLCVDNETINKLLEEASFKIGI